MNKRNFLDYLSQGIINSRKLGGITCVAIDGPGCSGKTKLSIELKQKLENIGTEVAILPIDNFCLPRNIRYRNNLPNDLQVYKFNFDHNLFESVIKLAKKSESLYFEHNFLNVSTDNYENNTIYFLSTGGVLIVEGIHTLKRNLLTYYDYSIYLHISKEEQIRRARIRDLTRGNTPSEIEYKYSNRYRPSFRHYLLKHTPKLSADVLVDNTNYNFPLITD